MKKANNILKYDLIMFGTILRAERAPVEKRFFRNDDDKVVPFEVRPSYCLSKKQSKAALNSLAYRVFSSIPKHELDSFKQQAEQLSSEEFMFKSYVLTLIFEKYIPLETLKEYLPSLFNNLARNV